MRELAKRLIPKRWHDRAAGLYGRIRYFGFRFRCPCCGGTFRVFLPYGVRRRENAQCPGCFCLERHRLLWLYLRQRTPFFTGRLRVLDVAPVPFLQRRWRRLRALDYLSVDLESPAAMVHMDTTRLALPDEQVDAILCYHVLEHVRDDRQALRELFRVLRPGGWAILQARVDHGRSTTYEDPAVTSPEECERVFGQRDHVRIYGEDYVERLRQAGFEVKVDRFVDELGPAAIRRYSLRTDESIYFCTKP
jgi:predicted SAM-dependent methyltransferase